MPDRPEDDGNASGKLTRRLDQILVDRGLIATRAKARDAILRGEIRVAGVVESRPGRRVAEADRITLSDQAAPYVSRGGLKLVHALDHFAIPTDGRIALDVGASTGGFTDVLLKAGAARVYAVDVGHGQLDPELAADQRVLSLEGVNARALTADHVPERVGLIVADVSFISLKLVLPAALALAAPGAHLVALIKPQFEAGRNALGKHGVVRDEVIVDDVCRDIERFVAETCRWRVLGVTPSPLLGGDGNREFLIAAENPDVPST